MKALGIIFLICMGIFQIQSLKAKEYLNFDEDQHSWKVLSYASIRKNKVEFKNNSICIDVNDSAGLVILPFQMVKSVQYVYAAGNILGNLNLKDANDQGKKGQDDYLFRLGLIIAGKKTLNFVQKMLVPQWVKALHTMAPSQVEGIDRIHFLNLANTKNHLNRIRTHPSSKLITEEVVAVYDGTGNFILKKKFQATQKVIGLWISSDGDDTQSNYQLKLTQVKLTNE